MAAISLPSISGLSPAGLGLPSSTSSDSTAPTQPLHRRVLFPDHPGPIPPLFSPRFAQLDAPLYDLIAVFVQNLILPVYTRISPVPSSIFVGELVKIFQWVVSGLEKRFLSGIDAAGDLGRSVPDIQSLLMKDIPRVLERHVMDFRHAKRMTKESGGQVSFEEAFHRLQPNVGVMAATPINLSLDQTFKDIRANLPKLPLDQLGVPKSIPTLPFGVAPASTLGPSAGNLDAASSANEMLLDPAASPEVVLPALQPSPSDTAASSPASGASPGLAKTYVPAPEYIRQLITSILEILLPVPIGASSAIRIFNEIVVQVVSASMLAAEFYDPWFIAAALGDTLQWVRIEREKREKVEAKKNSFDKAREGVHWLIQASITVPRVVLERTPTVRKVASAFTQSVLHDGFSIGPAPASSDGSLALPVIGLAGTLFGAGGPAGRAPITQIVSFAEFAVKSSGGVVDEYVRNAVQNQVLTVSNFSWILEKLVSSFPDGQIPERIPVPSVDEQQDVWAKTFDEVALLLPTTLAFVLSPKLGPVGIQDKRDLAEDLVGVLTNKSANIHLFMALTKTVLEGLFPELKEGAGAVLPEEVVAQDTSANAAI